MYQLCIDRTSQIWACNFSSLLIPHLRSKWHLEVEILLIHFECIEAGSRIRMLRILEFKTTVNLESWMYHMCLNMVIKEQELRWKVKQWVWNRGSVSPVSNRGGVGVFSMKMKGLSWPQSPNNSSVLWYASKKPFWTRWYKWDSFKSEVLTAWPDFFYLGAKETKRETTLIIKYGIGMEGGR